jgi:nitrite reductase/ring-hydroxylating ferredoxin subunit
MPTRTEIGPADKIAPGTMHAFTFGDRDIDKLLVANVRGQFVAYVDSCPHQGARLTGGTIGGTLLESDPQEYQFGMDECVLRCPWHGWEFDLRSGETLFATQKRRLIKFKTEVVDGVLYVVR